MMNNSIVLPIRTDLLERYYKPVDDDFGSYIKSWIEVTDDIKIWMKDNIFKEWRVSSAPYNIHFQDKDEAMLFKLTWL